MYGWTGKVLHIDATKRKYEIESLPLSVYKKYIGGKGLSGYYLKDHVSAEYDSYEMPLIFFTGPLNNTISPTSGRMTIMSRSPLTGTVGDASVGGKLGNQIKKAGYDGIIVSGKSSSLIGIRISEAGVEFVDAALLKGATVSEMNLKLSKIGANAVIGPAAENGVMFSNIMVDGHFSAGRNGLGLIMAAKQIKYIYVIGNDATTEVFDKNKLKEGREEVLRLVSASPALMGDLGISNFGTGALYDLMDSRRMMPTDNFRATSYRDAKRMNAWNYDNLYDYKKKGCSGCHIQCKKVGKNSVIMPEFETMSHFSALLENRSIETVVDANVICNDMGMDTISAAVTLGCYKEISNKKLTPEDILLLLNDIAMSTGEGRELKLGSCRYAAIKSVPYASMTVKKMELPGYDPRGAYGMALAYATSTRGACHLRAYPISHEILRKPVVTDRFSFSGKARIIKISEDVFAAVDSLVACKFIFFAASLEEYAKIFYGVTGIKTSGQELMKCGERIYYNERIMNAKNGFAAIDDDLPERFFIEAGSHGEGICVPPLSREDFLEAKANYYKIRGLDDNAQPKKKKMEELGLV
jgi:aldehyde:ferredoxin oxidoreductase